MIPIRNVFGSKVGEGVFEQALLDVYTIKRELGRLTNFSIGFVGDLANGVLICL